MSHDLHVDQATGEAAIAYAGATPWHQYGQVITDPYDLSLALAEAHVDFEVETVPMYHNIDEGGTEVVPEAVEGKVVIRRKDTLVPLGTASDRYRVCQTEDAVSFMKTLLGDGKVKLEVAGALGKGERVWFLVKIDEDAISILGDDIIERYFLVALGHDGQFNIVAMFTSVRVVCNNTLGAALRAGKDAECIKIRHTGDIDAKMRMAATLLRDSRIYFNEVTEAYRFLATKHLKKESLLAYLMEVCEQVVPYSDVSSKVKNRIELFQAAHDTGLGTDIKGVRGTLWGAYNAVTEVVDHKLAAGNKEPVKYMGFGTGREIKRRALAIAVEHAEKLN